MDKRRRALTAGALMGAAAGAVGSAPPAPGESLAIDGGTPVRTKPLENSYWGTSFYGEEERSELTEVLETRRPFRWYGPGKDAPRKVATFEKEFAARMQTKYALAVTSGTAALQCAVAALGVGPGDEVILPSWTWHSCFNAVVLAGGLPVCAEIDESFDLDPADIERHITPHTKVIMAVHLQGTPCNLERILAIARKHNLKVLEDCAQSVGGSYRGKPLGSHGDIGIYSLQLNKSITAGEGGAVVTNNPTLFERAARFHDMGGLRAPHQAVTGGTPSTDWFIGANYRMNEFSGGVLLAQVRKLDRIVGAVRGNARRVLDGIKDLPGIRMRHTPDPAGDLYAGVFLAFATQAKRDQFMAAMKAEGVPARPPGGSVILPLQKHIQNKVTHHPNWPSFTSERGKAIRYGPETCPKTIDILNRYAGVSMDPKFTEADTTDIVRAIRKVYTRMQA